MPRKHFPTVFSLAALVLTWAALPTVQADEEPAAPHWTLWLGDRPLMAMDPPSEGVHRGRPFSVGGQTWRALWEATPGQSGRPQFESLTPAPPAPVDYPAEPVTSRKELVVVIPADLAVGSALLPAFLDARCAEGWQTVLATEDDWDQPTAAPDDRPARLRAWLAAQYADEPGAFLLLIGDPSPVSGDLPMRQVHPMIEVAHWYNGLEDEMEPIPTDAYYGDLDGDWDCDGDGLFAEYPDDAGPGCTDFGPELLVGRIPIYGQDSASLDRVLARILARDMEQDKTYRRAVLLPGAMFGIMGAPHPVEGDYEESTDGACILDTVARDLPASFEITRLYEDEGLTTSPYPHEGAVSRDNVVQAWQEGRGLVVWAGHGSTNGVYRMVWADDWNGDDIADYDEFAYPPFLESADADDLAAAPGGAFTFHISCDNGYPEEEDNLGRALLEGGAVATATASRPSFGMSVALGETWEPRPDMPGGDTGAYYYAMLLAEGYTAGEALAFVRYGLPGDGWEAEYGYDYTWVSWTTSLEFNLYGDPTRSLEQCQQASDCDDGSLCNGVEACANGFCVHGEMVDCSSLDSECTRGVCDDGSGTCGEEPRLDGTPCDDGAWCSEVDTCQAGICEGTARACGERDGWLSSCDEASQTCQWEELPQEEPRGCACSGLPQRGGAMAWLAALAGLLGVVLTRRNSGRNG